MMELTFDGIGFRQLSAIFQQRSGYCRPCLSRLETQVDVCTREIVDMELISSTSGPIILRLVCRTLVAIG